ncbi:MAG: histidine ammonia-lyase [Bacteroidetes bacterium]|nr:histidine ammonia-lyase [Bacteroidota bacterium]
MNNKILELGNNELTKDQILNYLHHDQSITISTTAAEAILKCRKFLNDKINGSDDLFYGINTGFGFLQNVRINKDQLETLQKNLLQSHACGLGEEVPAQVVKLMLLLKIKSLSYGYSGISMEVVQRLMDMHNNNVLPVIYTQGSLGASGDLSPLSHLCLPLIGEGEVVINGQKIAAKDALKKLNWPTLNLQSKEGLALINGTQFMSAYGLHSIVACERLLNWAALISSISFDAFDGNIDCFNEHIHALRPHRGQVNVALQMRSFLKKSEISSKKKTQVQDPYSFRCIPQVLGAVSDTFEFVSNTFFTEVNSVTDNPNIFPNDDLILSGGNFHGQPLAMALDFLAIAMSEVGSISERRTFQLLSGQRGLPLFLINNPGLNSGLMIPQYTAASLASENKQLSTPASVDTISSSNNQEDHVSMGANAATKCLRVIKNVENILAIELLTAAQAIEYKRPLKSSPTIEKIIESFRKEVTFNQTDRVLHNDMVKAAKFINQPLEKYL